MTSGAVGKVSAADMVDVIVVVSITALGEIVHTNGVKAIGLPILAVAP